MSAYCTTEDALNWVTPGSVTPARRAVAAVQPDTDTLVLEDHRLKTGFEAQLWLRGGEMPEPLVEGTVYYAIGLSGSTFQLAATLADAMAAAPIDITTEGTNVHMVAEIPWDFIVESNSAVLDQKMIANAFPLPTEATVPPIVRRYCSLFSLVQAATFVGKTDLDLEGRIDRATKDLDEMWAKGKPIRGPEAPPPTNTAVSGPRASGTATDSRGWLRTRNGAEVIP